MRSSSGNGAADRPFTPEAAAADVDRINEEIAQVEAAVAPLAEQIAGLGDAIRDDIEAFRSHGLETSWSLSPQGRERAFRQQLRGALALLGGEPFLAVERERLQRRVAGDTRLKMSSAERDAKLADLRRALRRAQAHYEIVVRAHERDGALLPRVHTNGEFFLLDDATLREEERA